MNTEGDLKELPKHTILLRLHKKKHVPTIKHRYYYEKPGLPEFSAWYINEVGGSYSHQTPGAVKDGEIKQCTNVVILVVVDILIGGKYSADYFELQKCRNGADRICKKCKICKMGLEVVDTDCGEGGGESDRTCCACSECPDGTYKVYGCDKPNSFFDTECKPI